MAVSPLESAPRMAGFGEEPQLAPSEAPLVGPNLLDRIPEKYRDSLRRTQAIARMVGSELGVSAVDSVFNIPPQPGVYVFSDQISSQVDDISVADFSLETR